MTSETSVPPASPSSPALPQAGPDDVLVTGSGVALLPLAASDGTADLATMTGQPVTARGVTVQSVVTDRGFWVGPTAEQRVFVLFDVEGESDVDITPGQSLDFTGNLVANPSGFLDGAELTDAEGAPLLGTQGVHLEVRPADLDVVG